MSGAVAQALEWLLTRIHRIRVRGQFRHHLGFDGNFENPRSYQEKIQFRKIYGNHRFYACVTDKYRVREYVANRVGEKYLVPLLAVHDRLQPGHFAALPKRFIIKANHGRRWQQLVHDKSTLDIPATLRCFNKYIRARYGRSSGERHYSYIEPKILIEELLEGNTGGCPWDYGFFCYNGSEGFDYTYTIAAPDGRSATFTRAAEVLISEIPAKELAPHLAPRNFGEMVQVARALSADFDFVRVDLYSVGNKVYFGGLTCTPHHGYRLIPEPRGQKMRDEMWELDAYNPRLYNAPRSYGLGMYPNRRSCYTGQPLANYSR
jgi:TupA-like ATPgrasp